MDQANCGLPLLFFFEPHLCGAISDPFWVLSGPHPESEEGLPGLPEAAGELEAVLRGALRKAGPGVEGPCTELHTPGSVGVEMAEAQP